MVSVVCAAACVWLCARKDGKGKKARGDLNGAQESGEDERGFAVVGIGHCKGTIRQSACLGWRGGRS